MLRVLVLIAALIILRESLLRKRRRSLTAISPYMNSLDEAMSAQQLSLALEETAKFHTHARRRRALR